MDQTAITRMAGVFAPGHIGELTRIVPFEMADAVLADTGAVQRRVLLVPARVTVHLLLAGVLFTGLGYRQVFDRLCAGLPVPVRFRPSGSALRQARQRLGPGADLLVRCKSGRNLPPVARCVTDRHWAGSAR
ncbi:transposase domain-containing protein [Streptomyces uncialis]|uniref:transposase domain-containing protein n=1 Tax=Streptomyces uncialis TaxID=1048205 RepID=UPI0038154715